MARLGSLCVYCGSNEGTDTSYVEAASKLGSMLAERNIKLIFGGGGVGLMGVVANAALKRGGQVIGVIPSHLLHVRLKHEQFNQLHIVANMHERKQKMFELSDAFAILPGGLGTLDEAIEMITWKQLRIHPKPIILVDINNYWAPFLSLMNHIIFHGFASADISNLITVAPEVEAILPAISKATEPTLMAP